MIELTEPIQQALDAAGPPLQVVDPRTNTPYFLVSADAFRRAAALLEDDALATSAEMLDRVMIEDDSNDPYLAELQKKYGATARRCEPTS